MMSGRNIYRRDALIRSAQPEALDDLPRVTAPHERIFQAALFVLCLALVTWIALAV